MLHVKQKKMELDPFGGEAAFEDTRSDQMNPTTLRGSLLITYTYHIPR